MSSKSSAFPAIQAFLYSRLTLISPSCQAGVELGASASELCYASAMRRVDSTPPKGLRQYLSTEQQRSWMEGETTLPDPVERLESLEQRFKYIARFEKL